MTENSPSAKVYVIDDDQDFGESIRWLLASVDLDVILYDSARSFLESISADAKGCIVTDIRMPGLSGLDLQQKVIDLELNLPVIVMTAHGDVDTAVRAMKAGALDFIQKPFNDQVFIDLVSKAISISIETADSRSKDAAFNTRLQDLTPRERQVLDLVVDGATNRSIASLLGISEKTVEAHRANVMTKTEAASLADLIKSVLAARPGTQGIP